MQIHFLEIVTPEVDATCKTYESIHGVTFSEPVPHLGNARTTGLANGGMLSVRAPLSETEKAIVRPYLLVDDIEAAWKAAEESGATLAHPPMALPGLGTFAIFINGEIESGLWQVS